MAARAIVEIARRRWAESTEQDQRDSEASREPPVPVCLERRPKPASGQQTHPTRAEITESPEKEKMSARSAPSARAWFFLRFPRETGSQRVTKSIQISSKIP